MIHVQIVRGVDSNTNWVRVKGHAMFAPQGRDIVCAAVSVLTQTTVMAMQKYLSVNPLVDKKDGLLTIKMPDFLEGDKKQQAQLLLNTMVLGLTETAACYPNYIQIKESKDII